jgi:predicted pyridoxine 5'-phosphate oxidase superfamily flavin-nucleotide-binding protein
LLTGRPGFVDASGSLTIRSVPAHGDPLADVLEGDAMVGLLAIEPASRRRFRVNGRSHPAVVEGGRGLRVDVAEALGNCPRYIQRRDWTAVTPTDDPAVRARGAQLERSQTDWIRMADTFFIATTDDAGNADASHRGGPPGFVTVVSPDRLEFPDYPGNNMFLTLGNLDIEPTAGLLFVDWDTGAVLHLSGSVDVRPEPAGRDDGVARTIVFSIEHVVERDHVVPLRWSVAASGS